MPFYAVKIGRKTGIYESWKDCFVQVDGYSGAEYKKFSTKEDAEYYLCGESVLQPKKGVSFVAVGSQFENVKETVKSNSCRSVTRYPDLSEGECVAFSDGSYDHRGSFAFGGVIYTREYSYMLNGRDDYVKVASLGSVGAEIVSICTLLLKIVELGIHKATIYVDYEGLVKWVDGSWEARSDLAVMYRNFVKELSEVVDLKIEWVKGHSGVTGNDLVDKLARNAKIQVDTSAVLNEVKQFRKESVLVGV